MSSSLRSSLRRFVRHFVRASLRSSLRSLLRSFVRRFVVSFVRSFVRRFVRRFVGSFVASLRSGKTNERVLCHTGRQNTQQSDRNNVFNQACDMTYTRRVPAPSRTPVCVARDDGGGDNDDGLT